MAKFKISKIFKITNRGHVLSGNIIDGAINSGDLIHLELDGSIIKLEIKSVEYVDRANGYAETGLMLGTIKKNIRELLQMMTDQIVVISKRH